MPPSDGPTVDILGRRVKAGRIGQQRPQPLLQLLVLGVVAPKLAVAYTVQIVSILYSAALAVATWRQAQHVLATGTTFATLDLPLWPGYMVVFAGLFLAALMMLADLGQVKQGRSRLFSGGE